MNNISDAAMLLKKYLKEYKFDLLAIAFLLGMFAFLSVTFWGRQTSLLIDCGREFYVPMEMLKGSVLYKDIINIYGPLSYQINALFYMFLGQKVDTLYIAGTFNALLIIGTLYLISRIITSTWVSFAVSFLVVTLCVYNYYIFNYISPYSYAASYGLGAFLLSVLFIMLYFKHSKPVFVPISFFFISIALLLKYEYTIYLFLMCLLVFLKPVSKKYLKYSLVSFITMPIISWGTLFLQGLTMSDCIKTMILIKNISSASTLKYFYTSLVGVFYSNQTLIASIKIFILTMILFAIILGISSLVKLLIIFFDKDSNLSEFILPAQILSLIAIFFIIPKKIMFVHVVDTSLSWMPIVTTAILLGFIFNIIRQGILSSHPEPSCHPEPPRHPELDSGSQDLSSSKINLKTFYNNIKTVVSNLDTKDRLYIILTAIALTSALKTYFFLNLHVYGTFMLPLILIINVVFLTDYLPKFWRITNKEAWKCNCIVILVLVGFFSTSIYQKVNSLMNYPVVTARGTIYTVPTYGTVFDSAISYITRNIPYGASFLMIPESPMLNFLTNRDSDNTYLSLIPLYVEVFGEDNIVNDLTKNPPNFIMINNRDSTDYGFPFFCRDYGRKICGFAENNYKFEDYHSDSFQMLIGRMHISRKKVIIK